jgi:CelD/BcsL family acetyltransferase involved in cellulose biosynthesis
MRLELLDCEEKLESIAQEWNELALPSPMQSPEWLIPWWQVYGRPNRELAVLALRSESGSLVGLCPWYIERHPAGHRLKWLGDEAACSDHASVLLRHGAAHEVLSNVADWLSDCGALRLSRLQLESVDADDNVASAVVASLRARDWLAAEREEPGSAWIDLPTSWEEYLSGVSKNHRKRCRRWFREFFESGRAQVEIANRPAECARVFDYLVELHNERRRAAGSRGAFENGEFRSFHRLAIRRLAGRGRVELRLLSVDGQPMAAEYLLVDASSVYAYQSGLHATGEVVSAGSLSMLSLIHDAIVAGRRRADLLRGTESYKFSWGAAHRPAQTIVLRPRTVAGVFGTCFDAARERAKSWKHAAAQWRISDLWPRGRQLPAG